MRKTAIIVLCGLAGANALIISPTNVARHPAPSMGLFDGLKKMVDPEDAMGRGVFMDEVAGGDGSADSLAKTRQKAKQASKPKQSGGGGIAGTPNMMKFEPPKFPDLPNPFGKK